MAGEDKHERAREQTLSWLVDAVRRGDYLEAAQWLDTLATVDGRFSLTADEIVAHWRARATRMRNGGPSLAGEDDRARDAADYRGLFGALLQHSYDSIVVSAVEDGWILECSRSFVALTGYAREELLGRTSLELGLIESGVREQARTVAMESRAAGGFETRLRRKDGELRRVEFSPQVLAGDALLLTIVRDVTQVKTTSPPAASA